jgi:hypothetical protein
MTPIMLRGHEMYVRIRGIDGARRRVDAAVAGAAVHDEEDSPYCVVLWDDFRAPEQVLEQLSRDLATEALWLVWQKQVDAFAFQRWLNGEPIRRLAYGVWEKERTWELVDGAPEPWETDAFFSPRRLEMQLKLARMYPGGWSESDLRRVWQEHVLEVDNDQPVLNGLDSAYVVARHYTLPGWTL